VIGRALAVVFELVRSRLGHGRLQARVKRGSRADAGILVGLVTWQFEI
jgi:hypothetical protein